MEKRINIFLEFSNTQFSTDIDSVVENYLRGYEKDKYKLDSIPNLSKKQLEEEFTGEKPLSSLSKEAIQKAIELYTSKNILQEGIVSLLGADKLDKVVGEFKEKENTKFMILTKSRYPNAIKALYEINDFENLKVLQILPNNEGIQNKKETIDTIEKEAFRKGADKVCNIFIHHDNAEIKSFRKNRNPDCNLGIHVTNGVSDHTISKLKNAVCYVNLEEAFQSDLKDLSKSKNVYKSIDNLLRTDLDKTIEKKFKSTDNLPETSSVGKEKKGAFQTIKDLFTKRKRSDPESMLLVEHDATLGAVGGEDLSKMTGAINKKQQKPRQTSDSPSYIARQHNLQFNAKKAEAAARKAMKKH
ncbi:hypothetical protein [Flavobacterium poyangense]|uniref:hypothetical protein n=1 Tax=Flavobacterium poyangense TaxID=2204302 RepID=UPI00142343F3|nr:hypothetical protein [Flavobacterium sp. JXAS1]